MRFALLSVLLLFMSFTASKMQAQHVSQYLNQVVSYAIDENNPPTQLHLSLHSSDVELQYIRGTRIMISGKVSLSIPNIFFLETLINRGRYHLFLTPDGGTGLRLEDKPRQPMILKGAHCQEEVNYLLYLPETIETVIFEDKELNVTEVIRIKNRISKALTSANSSQLGNQITIKDN